MKQIKELDKQVKLMQKRLEDYGKYEGMILNKNYHKLMKDIDTIKYNVDNGVDVKPQTITGLIKRVKNVKKTKVIDMFDIYVPQLDNPKSVREALNIKFNFDWKIEELPKIFIEKAQETLERIRNKYRRKSTKDFEPESEPPEQEVYYTDEVLEWVYAECKNHGRTVWIKLIIQIEKKIRQYGRDKVAQMFEDRAKDLDRSGELDYDTAKHLVHTLDTWGWDNLSLESNKNLTEALEKDYGFGDV